MLYDLLQVIKAYYNVDDTYEAEWYSLVYYNYYNTITYILFCFIYNLIKWLVKVGCSVNEMD